MLTISLAYLGMFLEVYCLGLYPINPFVPTRGAPIMPRDAVSRTANVGT